MYTCKAVCAEGVSVSFYLWILKLMTKKHANKQIVVERVEKKERYGQYQYSRFERTMCVSAN